MNNLELIQKLPNVQVILSDDMKTICSVRISVERTERVDSGSMMFHHNRYLTFGQTVVFYAQDVSNDQAGALFFKTTEGAEALEIINNIHEYIPHGKEKPDDSVLIGA